MAGEATISIRTRRIMAGAARYAPLFTVEVLAFWLILLVVDSSGYGTDYYSITSKAWYGPVSLLMVAFAMGAGEARFHLYRRVWSVASLNDAFAIGLAVAEASALLTGANLLIPDGDRPLRILAPILAAPAVVIAIGLVRLLPRLRASSQQTGNRLLVVIPDADAYATVKALAQQSNPDWTPVAVLTTTEPADVGRTLAGIPVLGTAANLSRWIKSTDAQGVAFVEGGTTDRRDVRHLFAQSLAAGVPVFVVPVAHEWFQHSGGFRLRQLSADDLVGRDERTIDLGPATMEVRNRTVLVTGAAGSIGSELSRLLAGMQPKRLVLLDINESGLFDLSEEIRLAAGVDLREALVSINDREDLLDLFAQERPDIVFHAAAYKHVPMLETHPAQAVLTNVIGTRNTLRCADAAGVHHFVLISTDKAASRHSVMGCTKRLCEQLVLGHKGQMSCWAVRFGNVVGSRGSVVPLFERQIEHGGPVTITHPDVSRYLMTIREASALVLSTLTTGETGHLYMLDMGEPVRILDLAKDLIRSRGLQPETGIKIVFTGLRPGERLTEELLGADESWRPTNQTAIREVISPSLGDKADLAWTVERLERLARARTNEELVRVLKTAAQGPAEQVDEPGRPGAGGLPKHAPSSGSTENA